MRENVTTGVLIKMWPGEQLRKKTPAGIAGADEIGAIVSMWTVVEAMVAVALEDGYLTKGNGQNLSAFYFRTDRE